MTGNSRTFPERSGVCRPNVRYGGLSYASDRRVIELAKASKSLEEVARIMKRTPERIRKVAMRLGLSFKTEKKK